MPNPRRLIIFPAAIADLIRLREFIHAHNPNAAARAAKRIREAIKKLPEQAFLGLPVADIDNPDLRDRFVSFGQGGYWVVKLARTPRGRHPRYPAGV